MRERIVLAYSGGLASSVAIPWLAAARKAEMITVTLDLGQGAELDEVRARALALGATRAHVLDVREEFAREYVLPALQAGTLPDGPAGVSATLAAPLIARKLAEIAAIENATAVAYGTDTAMTPDEQRTYARAHNIVIAGTAQVRRIKASAAAPETAAHVEMRFVKGVPTSVNGITMHGAELLESLTTIAAEHGIGSLDDAYAPAAIVLHAAYSKGDASALTGTVRLRLLNGNCEVVGRTVERTAGHSGNVGEGATFAQV